MKKTRILAIASLLALLVFLLCACAPAVTPEGETAPLTTQTQNANGETTPSAQGEDVNTQEVTEIDNGENDLEILTVPVVESNTDTEVDSDSDVNETQPQTQAETTSAKETEVQKIELPFVPAN